MATAAQQVLQKSGNNKYVNVGLNKDGSVYVWNDKTGDMSHGGQVRDFGTLQNWANDLGNNGIKVNVQGDLSGINGYPTGNGANYSAYGGGGSGSGSGGSTAQQKSAWQADHDQTANYLQNLYNSLGGRQQSAQKSVDDSYNQKYSALVNSRDADYQNLDNEQNKIDKEYTKSRNQLGDDLRNLLQSTSTQLGMYGAGDSSAARMAAVGATNLANSQAGDITDQRNDQSGDIALNRQQDKKKFDDDNNELNVWKQGQYKSINDDFNDQRNNIQDQQNQNDNTLRQRLAGAGVSSNLDGGIQNRINDISARYANAAAPTTQLQNIPQYKSTGISTADLSGSISAPQMSTADAMQYLNPTGKKDDKKNS